MNLPRFGAGRRLYLCSPSGAVLDAGRLQRGIDTLGALGFHVVVDPALQACSQRFAGSDDERLAALYRAAASGCELVMASRGGYGLSRLLSRLDWARLRGPTWVGHSDFTALALAGWDRGLSCWNGPMLLYDFGTESPEAGTLAAFAAVLDGRLEVRFPLGDAAPSCHAEGPLWGGNLSMLLSLLGTPWWPSVEGGLLWLEDVNEAPYRVERMLLQLLDAGVLGRQRAILIGGLSEYRLTPLDNGYDVPDLIALLRQRLDVPILTGLPFGHLPLKATLPNGWHCHLEARNGEARLCGRAP